MSQLTKICTNELVATQKSETRFWIVVADKQNEIIKSYLLTGFKQQPICTPLPPTRNKIIYKTASSDRPNSGSGKPSQNQLRSKAPPSCPSGRYKPQSFIETKMLRFCNLNTTNFKNKHGPVCEPHAPLSIRTKKSTSRSHFLAVWRYQMRLQNRKINSKGRPVQRTSFDNCV